MSIAKLKGVVSPPSNPSETGSEHEWSTVEERLGTTLPRDYKDYVREFGSGCVGDFLWVFNPFSANQNLKLERQVRVRLDALKELDRTFGEEIPFPLFPQAGGLLPAGATDNGDCLYWLTLGDPQNWPIVVNESRGPEWEKFDLTLTDFLAAILSKTRVSGIFPDDFPPDNVTFRPRR